MSFKIQNKTLMPYTYLIPALILIVVFLVYPIINVFYYSMQNYMMSKPYANKFIGLENFRQIIKDPIFYSSLYISFKWVAVEVSMQFIFGLLIAVLLNQKFKGRGVVRAIVFSPWAISAVLTTMMWSLMYNQHMGVINDIFLKMGIIKTRIAWTSNLHTVFWSVAVAELWRGIPFFAITFLAALQTIPNELYESCSVDGGNWRDSFFHITLPFLKDTIIFSTLLRTVWEFNNVDLIYTMTGGGPANETTTLTQYVAREAIQATDFGYGSALMVIGFLLMLAFAIFYLKISNFGKEE
jgi:multiple sugar transport system permease protein